MSDGGGSPALERPWLIVPAAGRGTRFGSSFPKALAPFGRTTILGAILDELSWLVGGGVIVCSPSGEPHVRDALEKRGDAGFVTAVQTEPLGMADAVAVGLAAVPIGTAEDAIVVWGDQASVSGETVREALRRHRREGASLTFPVAERTDPYTAVVRRKDGAVLGVAEAREGDPMPNTGESDCGVFIARFETLRESLAALREETFDSKSGRFRRPDGSQTATGEFNFLPLIGWLAQRGLEVLALRIARPIETLGVNTKADLEILDSGKRSARANPGESGVPHP